MNQYEITLEPKPLGILALERIGLEAVREACPLFDAWLTALEQRARPAA